MMASILSVISIQPLQRQASHQNWKQLGAVSPEAENKVMWSRKAMKYSRVEMLQ